MYLFKGRITINLRQMLRKNDNKIWNDYVMTLLLIQVLTNIIVSNFIKKSYYWI